MRKYLVFMVVLLSINLKAQSPPAKFGFVTVEELKLKKYEPDTTASAVILFDKGESVLDDQLRVEFTRHVRIKFFSQSAIEQWANRTIYIDRTDESLSKLKGVTYNLEGNQIVQSALDETSIFKTKYDRWTNEHKFTLPNVKEGSIIEYSYVIRTSASLLPSWQFQYTIPVAWSEYKTVIPSIFTFTKETRGYLAMSDHTSEKNGTIETFIIKNAPAFKEEPYTLNPDDYISQISFHLKDVFIAGVGNKNFQESWSKMVDDLVDQQDFGGQVKGSGFLKDIVAKTTAGLDDEKKIEAIYNYVKSNVTWNKVKDKIPDRPFKKVLEEKKGSCSELNLLLVSMLRKANLNAYPVLLSTRDHGMIRPFNPRFSQFNYVICLVKLGDKKILLDATESDLPMKSLPKRCLNGEGLVVSKEEMEWVPLVSARSKKSVTVNCKVDENGEITGNLVIATDGIEAGETRATYKDLGQEKYVKDFTEGKNWEVSKSSFENMETPAQAVKENYSITVRDHAQVAGNVIYLNPYLVSQMKENIFKSETRLYPVDFSTPFDEVYLAKIELPENYAMEEIPKPKMLALPNGAGRFVSSVTQSGSAINFVSQLIINRSVFSAEEYPNLREFFNQVVAKQADQIVLKKK